VSIVKLGNRFVGDGFECFTIAEIGGAFKTLEEGKRLIDAALECKVDSVKFQTFEAETIVTKNIKFDLETTGKVSQYELFKQNEISKDLQMEIVDYANKKDITIFSAPSHIKDLDIMQKMNLPIYKIGSDLACHIPLLKKVAKFDKPIILSTGLCTLDEVRESVNAIRDAGNDKIVLLHCVSDYPTKFEEANLHAINTMKKEFQTPVGFSDHTIGILGSLSAVAMGANVLERHLRHQQNSPGIDDMISLTKDEYADLIQKIKSVEKTKGTGEKIPSKSEQKHLLTNRASIISMSDIQPGQVITEEMIDVRRPGTGIQPIHFESLIGMKAKMKIQKEQPITWEMLEKNTN